MKVMPQVLQKLMRHSDIQTTMTFYAHLDSVLIIESLYLDKSPEGDQEVTKHRKSASK
jgi:integrase